MDGGQEPELVSEEVGDVVPTGVKVRRRPRRRWWPLVVVGVVVALLAGGVAYASTTDAWPGKEAKWDPAVEPLARFVENERGGTFEKPVEVVFNSRAEYSDQFAVDRNEIDASDKADLERSLATLRALGWVAGDLDLLTTSETMGDSGTVGFFRPEDGKIHVRGARKAFDTATKVTLVHELTHAYDFSHFDLDLSKRKKMTSGESFAYTSLVEGSAKLSEWDYIESLPEAERAAAYPDGATGPDVDAADAADAAAIEALPDVFVEMTSLPYALGPRFLQSLATRRGASSTKRAVNEALRRWPRSEEEIVDLDSYLDDGGPKRVAPPALKAGEVQTDEHDDSIDFGQVSLALLLAPHVGGEAAWRAVQGWAGDATVNYRRGAQGPHCLRIAVAFDNPLETTVFRTAADSWAHALPGATAVIEGDLAVLDTCDPGPAGPPVPEPAGATVTDVIVARGDLLAGLVGQGIGVDAARCIRDGVLGRLGVQRFFELDERLTKNPEDAEAQGAVTAASTAAARDCGVGGGG